MKRIEELYERFNYLTDRKMIYGVTIYEYDIRQANINVLYSYNKISYEEYRRLSESDKNYREITIGKMLAYQSDIYTTIDYGIKEAKKQLILTNHISNENIVRIVNDAVYIISPYPLKYTKFQLNPQKDHEVEFVCKNCFHSFLQLRDISIFVSVMDDDTINVDVKGLGKYTNLHESFLEFLVDIMLYKERMDTRSTAQAFIKFYENYIKLKLDISYYREFNPGSSYRLKRYRSTTRISPTSITSLNGLDPETFKSSLDIGYNLSLLRELYSIILS